MVFDRIARLGLLALALCGSAWALYAHYRSGDVLGRRDAAAQAASANLREAVRELGGGIPARNVFLAGNAVSVGWVSGDSYCLITSSAGRRFALVRGGTPFEGDCPQN